MASHQLTVSTVQKVLSATSQVSTRHQSISTQSTALNTRISALPTTQPPQETLPALIKSHLAQRSTTVQEAPVVAVQQRLMVSKPVTKVTSVQAPELRSSAKLVTIKTKRVKRRANAAMKVPTAMELRLIVWVKLVQLVDTAHLAPSMRTSIHVPSASSIQAQEQLSQMTVLPAHLDHTANLKVKPKSQRL